MCTLATVNKLSILIPVFNEEQTIYQLLKLVSEVNLIHGIEKEIILINDFSADNSVKEMQRFIDDHPELLIKLVEHKNNFGKGGAIRTGMKEATGEYTVIQDADLELVPGELNILLEPILENRADIVYGSRFLNSKKQDKESWLHRFANRVLTGVGNLVNRTKLTDMQTCYKMVPTTVLQQLNLKENRFAFDPEITARLAKFKNLKWEEVPITYHPRTHVEGKKIGFKDGFRALYAIIKYGWFTRK